MVGAGDFYTSTSAGHREGYLEDPARLLIRFQSHPFYIFRLLYSVDYDNGVGEIVPRAVVFEYLFQ